MTHWKQLVDKDYIGAYSLVGRDGKPKDFTLTIREVKSVGLRSPDAPKGKRKAVVYFKETDKGWVLNTTNATSIESLYGSDVESWVGQRVTLYATKVRSPKGGQIDGIRVRPKRPGGAPTESLPDHPVDEAMRAEQRAAFNEAPPRGREPGDDEEEDGR